MACPAGARSMVSVEELSVLIAGGGVAALEAALTLADVAEGQARVELLAPEPLFWYRPASVGEPFGLGTVRHFDLGLLAARAGAGMMLGALAGVDADGSSPEPRPAPRCPRRAAHCLRCAAERGGSRRVDVPRPR